MDSSREEFEETFHQARCQLIACEEDRPVAWAFWSASRGSMVVDIDDAAKALAESMDYPWEFMPEQGRARMKANARMVIEAAGLKVKP
ncbi:hypothetical protein K5E40_03695 [Pseudomonas baetica]|uniref:hypothetical protein n=1 Tax=Pseudomonas baetica TaxID=674054 RepID=UPI001C8C237B|nr:hypothetical protein [Pseudomonas baetica]MBX9404778.1 hypothetical protein [Pseudomonas baetica]